MKPTQISLYAVWLSRNEQEQETLLEDFLSLPQTLEVQVRINVGFLLP